MLEKKNLLVVYFFIVFFFISYYDDLFEKQFLIYPKFSPLGLWIFLLQSDIHFDVISKQNFSTLNELKAKAWSTTYNKLLNHLSLF